MIFLCYKAAFPEDNICGLRQCQNCHNGISPIPKKSIENKKAGLLPIACCWVSERITKKEGFRILEEPLQIVAEGLHLNEAITGDSHTSI